MANESVHVYAGLFPDRTEACKYTEAQWEPEPAQSSSQEEIERWESENPKWGLRSDLGVALDSDFIETILDEDWPTYLSTIVCRPEDLEPIRSRARADANVLVLIFSEAPGGEPVKLASTPRLKYCGQFPCHLG